MEWRNVYRGWSKERNTWIYGSLWQDKTRNLIAPIEKKNGDYKFTLRFEEVEDDSVSRCVGIFAKTVTSGGKEWVPVFIGDVIDVTYKSGKTQIYYIQYIDAIDRVEVTAFGDGYFTNSYRGKGGWFDTGAYYKATGEVFEWSDFYQKIMDEKRGAEDIYVVCDSRTSRQFLDLGLEENDG